MRTETILSAALGEPREVSISIHAPVANVTGRPPEPVLMLILEANRFLNALNAESVLDHAAQVTDTEITAVWVHQDTPGSFHDECSCRLEFAEFLATDLRLWAEASNLLRPAGRKPVLMGLEYSGLAALHSAWRHPDCFAAIGAISPALWFRDEWLIPRFDRAQHVSPDFLLLAGFNEDRTTQLQSPSMARQKSTVLGATCRLYSTLKKRRDCKSDCWIYEYGPDDESLGKILLPVVLHLIMSGEPPATAIR